ncbi:MAG: toprim domain-containing protein [Firmicutes bacterium]|nr:toprim domain-containing protein [Bacillota bacterium]
MQAQHHHPEEKFISVKPWRPCPICGKGDWCGFNSYMASCMRIREGSFKTVLQDSGDEAYLHWLEPGAVNLPAIRESDSMPAAQTAPIETRDRVYRDFLSLLTLSPRHREDLLRRGLSEWEIRKNYRSVPETETPWSICKRLLGMGHDLAGIPGFYKANGPRGGTYWTFERKPGYFIPVRDEKGRIQALQRRMDDCREGKYRLFSGHAKQGGCSCGSPAHVATSVKTKDHRVWITEGHLKASIASLYLGAVVVGALSAGAWRPVIPVLHSLNASEVVIAYDRDMETNPKVKRAFQSLKAELKKSGLAVNRAVWHGEKGIDDALATGTEVRVIRER